MTGSAVVSIRAVHDGGAHICAYACPVRWTPEEIKRRRDAKGLSQQELGDLIGASRRAVTNWETGKSEPRGSNLRALEKALAPDDDDQDTSEDAVLRRAPDSKFWLEAARRAMRNAETNPSNTTPQRGGHGSLPDHLRDTQSGERRGSDG